MALSVAWESTSSHATPATFPRLSKFRYGAIDLALTTSPSCSSLYHVRDSTDRRSSFEASSGGLEYFSNISRPLSANPLSYVVKIFISPEPFISIQGKANNNDNAKGKREKEKNFLSSRCASHARARDYEY